MKRLYLLKTFIGGLCPAALVASVILLSGCKTGHVGAPLALHPEAYRRVAILPICFGLTSPGKAAGRVDSDADIRKVGAEMVLALTNQFIRRGYELVGPVRVLCGADDWCGLSLTASGILREQFELEHIRRNHATATDGLYTERFRSSLPVLRMQLGLPEVDAMVLVERWMRYVPPIEMPPAAETGALILLGIVGAAGGDLGTVVQVMDSDRRDEVLYGSNRRPTPVMMCSLYIFDSRTQEIIYSNHRPQSGKNSARTARLLLSSLPKIRE